MDTEKYRVFIAYSHEDMELVKQIDQILTDNGLNPLWSMDIPGGGDFHEAIKNYITSSHIFMPILTPSSSERGWVHQEIGYAMALKIPVLPVSKGKMPGEMISKLNAITLSENPEDWKNQLTKQNFDKIVFLAQQDSQPLFECAVHQEDRTRMLAQYALKVVNMGYHGHVRQKATFSSYNIPNLPLNHQYWQTRHEPITIRNYLCDLLLKERRVLEEHARESGCSLIIYPFVELQEFSLRAKWVRIKTLLEFLESMPSEKVKIAVNEGGMPRGQNLIILGDWFYAEAVRSFEGEGFRQTIFTSNAPTVSQKKEEFDLELNHLLHEAHLFPESSLEAAIKTLKNILTDLENNMEKR